MREIQGRESEQGELSRLLQEARIGHGGGRLLWGDPGIGKTALLRDATARATDFQTLTCRGFPAETDLEFAALHELLLPIADRAATLPPPQAQALAAALGRAPGPVDRFLVGAALVTLLDQSAATQPVLLVVDDAQWVDAATAQALTFALRRVHGSRVALLVALRDSHAVNAWQALPVLPLARLADEQARRLLDRRAADIGAPRAERILRVADGNPLALLEMPIDAEDFAGIGWGPVTFGPRLRAAFADRLAEQPDPVRTLLTVVAAEDRGSLVVVTAAAAALGVTDSAWETAQSTGLLTVGDGRVDSRQRLLSGAAYDAATPAERRAAHLALADALHGPDDRDLRAWHLAATIDGPNAELAQALSDGSGRVHADAGALGAAAMLRRAAAITPVAAEAGLRLAAAARCAWDGGDIESARRLLALAETRTTPAGAARASDGLAGLLELVTGDPVKARDLFTRDAAVLDADTAERERAAGLPGNRARLPRLESAIGLRAVRAELGALRESGGVATLSASSAPTISGEAGHQRPGGAEELRVLADLAGWVGGQEDSGPIRPRLDLVRTGADPAQAALLLPPAARLLEWGLAEEGLDPYQRAATAMRGNGSRAAALGLLPQLAILQFANGRWEAGEETLEEAFELARASGADLLLAQCWNLRGRLAAQRGDAAAVADSLDRGLALSRAHGATSLIAGAYWHLGFHALGAGDPEVAYRRLRALHQPGHEAAHPTVARLAAIDMVEAACRVGRFTEAAEHAELGRQWALRSRSHWALAAAYTCRALLSDEDRTEHYYLRALAVGDGRHTNFGRARTQLQYGKWLRRVRRRRDAAEQLRTAADSFDLIGASAWAARTRGELELTGTGTKSPATGSTPLTAQESQVAKLAAQGLTNREIGAELFLSPRTVGHHMSRILEKLGLTSRAELPGIDFDNGMRLTRKR
ncbi:AAA family ATPase [Nocardia sp. NBC_00511]|uniref:AAA family ATPase n=1 Tax=Nocardia sp. NBC_00511 TaxID=2903591 RepID=UPI0030E3C5F4